VKRILLLVSILAAGLMLCSSPVNADLITQLDISNENLGITGDFATVTVSVTETTATFTVVANRDLLAPEGSFGIAAFAFNTSVDFSDSLFVLPPNWKTTYARTMDGFGVFEIREVIDAHGDRWDPLQFSITDLEITNPNQFFVENVAGNHYAAHIAGFKAMGPDNKTSAYFSDVRIPVPEPATMLLLGSGLIGLAAFGRKRFLIG